MRQDIISKYFFILFSLIPLSLVIGSAVSSINILLIAISFLFYSFYKKEWNWAKDKNIILLFVIYFYLIINSFISIDYSGGMIRNLGFVRFILFFAAFNYFFYHYEKFNKIFVIWIVVLLVVTLDVYLESITGKNMLGQGEGHDRVGSFFGDEQKVGGYIFCFYLLITGFLLNFLKPKSKKNNYIILLFSLFFLFSIVATGERSNAMKAIIAFLIFFSFSSNFLLKEKIISLLSVIVISGFVYSNSEFVKLRYGKQLFWKLESINHVINFFKDPSFDGTTNNDDFHRAIGTKYFQLYASGIAVFKDHPYFGVGNKNYRIVTCPVPWPDDWNEKYLCNTHPHQVYFEFLAEHGIIGTTILLVVFFTLIFKILRNVIISKNDLQLSSLIYVFLVFLPLLPSGAFFNDYYSTLFWINLSLMFAISRETNIYNLKNL